MTNIASMSLPAELRQQLVVEKSNSQTEARTADAEACRLVKAIARGEETAFRQLYDSYHRRLFRLALMLGSGDELFAQEVTQSVFVTAAAKLRSVQSEAHLWNWLAQVTRQQAARVWRERKRDGVVTDAATLPDCVDTTETDSALEEMLDDALISLEAGERQLIEWFYFEQWSCKEIAAQINATPKAVSSRLERSRAKLRSLISKKLSHET